MALPYENSHKAELDFAGKSLKDFNPTNFGIYGYLPLISPLSQQVAPNRVASAILSSAQRYFYDNHQNASIDQALIR
jgi:hypothetical protein